MALMNEERSASLAENCHNAQQETGDQIAKTGQSNLSLAGDGQTSGASQTGGRAHFSSSTVRVAPEPPTSEGTTTICMHVCKVVLRRSVT